MAKSVQVLIGAYSFDWQSFNRVFEPGFQLTHTIPNNIQHNMNKKFFDLVERRHEYTTGSHNIWDILSWRAHTECSITSDRIYALLALVQDGHTFDVHYGEELRDLFWRAGEHFQAWVHVEYMAQLKTALQLSNTDIARNIGSTESEPIKLRVSCVHIPSVIPWRSSGTACDGCGQLVIRPHRDEIIFCTNPSPAAMRHEIQFTHVVIRRKLEPNPTDQFRVTLTTEPTITGYDVPPGALMYNSKYKWATTKDYTQLRKKLKNKTLRPIYHNWAVFVPREYVVHSLEYYERSRTTLLGGFVR
jgi:hypothetical protein